MEVIWLGPALMFLVLGAFCVWLVSFDTEGRFELNGGIMVGLSMLALGTCCLWSAVA